MWTNTPERPLDPPEFPAFTGTVGFSLPFGGARLTVRAYVLNDELELDAADVWLDDLYVSDSLSDDQREAIESHFDAYAAAILFDGA
jgi:hypothetical protein